MLGEEMEFREVPNNHIFLYRDWIHRKINEDTAIACGYLASHSMEKSHKVIHFHPEELIEWIENNG